MRIVYAQSFLLRRGSRSAFRRGYGAVAPGVAAQVPRQEQKLMEFAPLVDLARAQQARARARSDVADLFEARARTGKVQIVATTHSPVVLADLHENSLQHTSLVYRLEGEPSSRITRLLDVPDAARVLATHDRADLLASGWFEDMVELAAVPSEPVEKAPDEGAAA